MKDIVHYRAEVMSPGRQVMPKDPTRRVAAAVWALVVVGLAGAVRLGWEYWPDGLPDPASGTWTTLAWDFVHGEFYRPVLAPSGYGGTRYMPLFFIAQGLLMRAHVDPVYAGVLVMQCSVLVAAFALYVALRANAVPARLALPFAGTLWATAVYQRFVTDFRADYLAAAFALGGVAAAETAPARWNAWKAAGRYACPQVESDYPLWTQGPQQESH